ncbi:hypothetical protein IWW38_004308 [Coemansia aciculifera]|uniref:Uncharacterized protein n=1 Tax=Coemansia aciculifera TaxID=417176 RepID=A0ACC1LYC2_9FUNG|nr:hypothetical protein IWW38_004308 [Coemansia aciculifera]
MDEQHQQISADSSDLITIPLIESTNDKFELEYRSDSGGLNSPSTSQLQQPPFSASDLVGKLLDDISHSQKAGNGHGSSHQLARSAAEYYSEPVLGQLWHAFIDRLLRLPTVIAFGRIATAADGTTEQRPEPADRRGELSEWLEDGDHVLFDLCKPLLAVREVLANPSTMWSALNSAVPASDILFTIREAAAAQQGVSQSMCISAAFLLSELVSCAATDSEPLTTDVRAVGEMLLRPLICGLANSSSDDSRQRCQVALLFMAWRQRRHISAQVARCTVQLKGDVVAMRDDFADITEQVTDKRNDMVLLSGCDGLLDDKKQTAVAASATLLARHSQVLEAMLAGHFAEAQAPSGVVRQVSLQCDHEALTGMLDVFHRCIMTFSCASSPSRKTIASALEGLRAELEHDYDKDELAVILELAAFYGLRPAVTLLTWILAAGFNALKMPSAYSSSTLDRLALLHRDDLCGYHSPSSGDSSSSSLLAIKRVLAAILLLRLDKIDPLGAFGDATDSFVSCALFLLYRE